MGPMSLCMVKRVRRLPSSLNSGTTETVGDATRGRDLPGGGGGPANGSWSGAVVEGWVSADCPRTGEMLRSDLLLLREVLPDERGEVACPKALASQLRLEALSPEARRSSVEAGRGSE